MAGACRRRCSRPHYAIELPRASWRSRRRGCTGRRRARARVCAAAHNSSFLAAALGADAVDIDALVAADLAVAGVDDDDGRGAADVASPGANASALGGDSNCSGTHYIGPKYGGARAMARSTTAQAGAAAGATRTASCAHGSSARECGRSRHRALWRVCRMERRRRRGVERQRHERRLWCPPWPPHGRESHLAAARCRWRARCALHDRFENGDELWGAARRWLLIRVRRHVRVAVRVSVARRR